MFRGVAHTVLAVWLNGSLTVCPYTCAHFPRDCALDRGMAGCSDDCCGNCGERSPERPKTSGHSEAPDSKEPCSCTCVCKGALCTVGSTQRDDDHDMTAPLVLEPLLTLNAGSHPEHQFTYRAEPPPPEPPTGDPHGHRGQLGPTGHGEPQRYSSTVRGALRVPKELVDRQNGEAAIWIADQTAGVARRQTVRTGRATGGPLVEVVEGLTPASRLIVAGREGLRDGQRIRVVGEDATLGLQTDGQSRL